ncbi:MAG TPA: penicillin acylase family protein [Hyphomonadaceae bacterium]|nr:penicillin acylase family protein [Hyphomonadaceae bacterium]HPN04559.1 penicillin acylase family protein [Hyphomonadaceae bacterium]
MLRSLTLAVSAIALAACATAPTGFAPGAPFDATTARTIASHYDARVIRDKFGVPHIYGKRNADVAYGLAYAHAEDDWKTIEEVIRSSRGTLSEIVGEAGAKSDDMILALGNTDIVNRDYDTKTSPQSKAVVEGYAAGLNLWCAEHADTGCARTMPITGRDIMAGFVNRPMSFYGFEAEIDSLLSGRANMEMSTKSTREAFIDTTDDIELGSNGLAVAPSRSADGHTRLAANSHQPYEGRVAWYEARLKSEEGIDLIGGLFPGTPIILTGVGPNFGWASTVNKPDLFDTFKLVVDDEKTPTKYRMDGAWKNLERKQIKYNVLKNGALVPVERTALASEHGPVYITDKGVFALSYVGKGDFKHLDQYLAINMAKSVDDWRAAQIKYNAIPSVNYIVGDSKGGIAYFWNAHMPKRVPGWDRTKVLPGDISETLWKGFESPTTLPSVIRPKSGYIVNANNSPLLPSGPEDNPKAENYPKDYGLDTLVTNRGLRAQELFGADTSITREEFFAYKMDDRYAAGSNVRKMQADLKNVDPGADEDLKAALAIVAAWDGRADMENRNAALTIFTGQAAMGSQIHDTYNREKALTALKATAALLKASLGRIDPKWSEVSRVARGGQSWPTNGGPDTLRAVYVAGDLMKDKFRSGRAGDTYVAIADWAPDGTYKIDTIHQYGSATIDAKSPHYADQAPIFAAEKWKQPPMTLEAVVAEATRDYHPGK